MCFVFWMFPCKFRHIRVKYSAIFLLQKTKKCIKFKSTNIAKQWNAADDTDETLPIILDRIITHPNLNHADHSNPLHARQRHGVPPIQQDCWRCCQQSIHQVSFTRNDQLITSCRNIEPQSYFEVHLSEVDFSVTNNPDQQQLSISYHFSHHSDHLWTWRTHPCSSILKSPVKLRAASLSSCMPTWSLRLPKTSAPFALARPALDISPQNSTE